MTETSWTKAIKVEKLVLSRIEDYVISLNRDPQVQIYFTHHAVHYSILSLTYMLIERYYVKVSTTSLSFDKLFYIEARTVTDILCRKTFSCLR